MNRRYLLWAIFCMVLGLTACTNTTTGTRRRQIPEIDTAKACASWRWIGIKSRPEARCPRVPGWKESSLFPRLGVAEQKPGYYGQQSTPDESPDPEVIQELQRFCVYEAEPGKRPRDLTFPPAASADLVRFDQDCAAITLSGDSSEAEIWKPLAHHFLSQVSGMAGPLSIDEHPDVRLAFLDTEPTGDRVPEKPGNSWHGYTLTHMARHLACAGDNCAAHITTRLALPLIKFDPKDPALTEIDTTHGGFFGMQSDLAKAIRDEVDAWREERDPDRRRHLVLNLSLAWDSELFGGLSEQQIAEMRAGTQAVYRALEYAAGHDALVFAAAGNQKRCAQQTQGPLLPAAWERDAPKGEACKDRETPLLYAVGGVQDNGASLVNSRQGGMPRRVAYADRAVVSSLDPDQPTAIYTGSSVATAVVSAIAAVVWDAFPHLKPHEVMSILDGSGEDLGFPADFWFVPSALARRGSPTVHKLSLCPAVQSACNENTNLPCPVTASCASETLERLASLSLPGEGRRSILSRTAKESGPPDSFRLPDPLLGTTCQPWLFPQPEEDPCPNCPPFRNFN